MSFDAFFEKNSTAKPRFEALPDDIRESVKYTRALIAGCTDPELVNKSVTALNAELNARGIIGKDAKLKSDDAIVTEQSSDPTDNSIRPVFDYEDLAAPSFTGCFLGCSATDLGEGTDLIYVVELPLDSDTLCYRTVVAQVHTARLKIETPAAQNEQDQQESDGEILAGYLGELAKIKDPEFQEDLKDLIEIFEEYKEFNAAFMRVVGESTTHMFANPFIGMNEEARTLVGEVIGMSFTKNVVYRIEADIIKTERVPGGTSVKVSTQIFDCEYRGIGTAMDYSKAREGDKEVIIPLEAMQPVVLVSDADQIEYQVPLKHIRSIVNATPTTCEDFRAQFVAKYPASER